MAMKDILSVRLAVRSFMSKNLGISEIKSTSISKIMERFLSWPKRVERRRKRCHRKKTA